MQNDTPSDPFDGIADQLDNPPLDWDPREQLKDVDKTYREDRVLGTVEERETLDGLNNKTYERLIVKLRDLPTRVSVRCWSTVLGNQVQKKDPRPGDHIGVEYLGSKPHSDPTMADIELYSMVVVPSTPRSEFETHAGTTVETTTSVTPRIGRTPGLDEPPPPDDTDDPGSWGADEEESA